MTQTLCPNSCSLMPNLKCFCKSKRVLVSAQRGSGLKRKAFPTCTMKKVLPIHKFSTYFEWMGWLKQLFEKTQPVQEWESGMCRETEPKHKLIRARSSWHLWELNSKCLPKGRVWGMHLGKSRAIHSGAMYSFRCFTANHTKEPTEMAGSLTIKTFLVFTIEEE